MGSINNHASLLSLPNELRSKIYHHVFSGSHVRLYKPKGFDACLPPQAIKSTYSTLQLVSRGFHNDASLHRTFLQSSTIYISRHDLEIIKCFLSIDDRKLIRHVCVRPERLAEREWRDLGWVYGTVLVKAMEQHYYECTLSSILDVIPNPQSVSTRRVGTHINTFEHDLDYSLQRLLTAAEKDTRGLGAGTLAAVRSSNMDQSARDYPSNIMLLDSDTNVLSYSSLKFTVAGQESNEPVVAACLKDFSYTLATCLKRTAAKYAHRWYYNFLYEAHKHNIEVLFNVNLMFPTETHPEDAACADDAYQMIENIPVSSKDWTIRLETDGKRYDFQQVPPYGTWKEWIASQLEAYGGPVKPKPMEAMGPLAKKQRTT